MLKPGLEGDRTTVYELQHLLTKEKRVGVEGARGGGNGETGGQM